MPKSMFSGDIEIGLLRIPIKLYKGLEDDEVGFHLYHAKCGSAITRPSLCSVCEESVEWADIVKGMDTTQGVVTFTDTEIEAVQPEATKTLHMIKTGPMPDPIFMDAFYWIEPEPRATHAYNVLTSAMKSMKSCVYGTVVLRTRERKCVIWIREGKLVLSTLLWNANVRAMPDVTTNSVSKAEIAMAKTLLDAIDGEMPETDRYQEAIIAAAENKSSGILITSGSAKPAQPREVVNLMDAMRQSIEAARIEKETAHKPKKVKSA